MEKSPQGTFQIPLKPPPGPTPGKAVCVLWMLWSGISAKSAWCLAVLPVFLAVTVRESFFSTLLNSNAVLAVLAVLYSVTMKDYEERIV